MSIMEITCRKHARGAYDSLRSIGPIIPEANVAANPFRLANEAMAPLAFSARNLLTRKSEEIP